MRNIRVLGLAGLGMAALAAVAWAQSTTAPLPAPQPAQTAPLAADGAALPAPAAPAAVAVSDAPVQALAQTNWGDAKAGQTKAGACAACHGLDGNAMQQNAPRIAGMPERYIAQQLALFKGGQRTDGLAALMVPFAAPLSAQDMRDIGAWYATQRAGAGVADDTRINDPKSPYNGQPFYLPGQTLYLAGDSQRGIPACMGCHGPNGSGNPGPAYPRIGGQSSAYAVQRLKYYRAGETPETNRANFDMMASIAKSLTDQEIASLGTYLQGLHLRSDQVPAAAGQPAAAGAAH